MRKTRRRPRAGLESVNGSAGRHSATAPLAQRVAPRLKITTKSATAPTVATCERKARTTPEKTVVRRFLKSRDDDRCRGQSACVYTVRRNLRDSSPYGTRPVWTLAHSMLPARTSRSDSVARALWHRTLLPRATALPMGVAGTHAQATRQVIAATEAILMNYENNTTTPSSNVSTTRSAWPRMAPHALAIESE